MAYGLKLWDASGNVILDVTDRITRYHGTVSVSSIAAGATYSEYIPGLQDDGTWFIVPQSGSLLFVNMYIDINYLRFQNASSTTRGSFSVEVFRG